MIANIVAVPLFLRWSRNAPLKLYGPKFRSMILTPEPLRLGSWTLRDPVHFHCERSFRLPQAGYQGLGDGVGKVFRDP